MLKYIWNNTILALIHELNCKEISKEQIVSIIKEEKGAFYAIYEEKE